MYSHVNASFVQVNRHLDFGVDSLTRKERMLSNLREEQNRQSMMLSEREDRLNDYAEALLKKSRQLTAKRRRWKEMHRERMIELNYSGQCLMRELDSLEHISKPMSTRHLELTQHQVELESDIRAVSRELRILRDHTETSEQQILSFSSYDSDSHIRTTKSRMKPAKHAMRAIDDQSEQASSRVIGLDRDVRRLHESVISTKTEIQAIRTDLSTKSRNFLSVSSGMKSQIQQVASLSEERQRQRERVKQTEAQLSFKMRELEDQISSVDHHTTDVSIKIGNIRSQIEFSQSDLKFVQPEKEAQESRLSSVRKSIASQEERRRSSGEKVSALRSQLSEISSARSSIAAELPTSQEQRSKNRWIQQESEGLAQLFLKLADQIELADRTCAETESELERLTKRGVDDEVRLIDLSDLKNKIREKIRAVEAELARDESDVMLLRSEVSDLTVHIRAKSPEKGKIVGTINDLWAIPADLAQGLVKTSYETVKVEVDARTQKRSRVLDRLKSQSRHLSERIDDARLRIRTRKLKVAEQVALLTRQIEFVRQLAHDAGIGKEMRLGAKSIQDFSRSLNSELLTWKSRQPASSARELLSEWEGTIAKLFEVLDNYYLT
jgi:chromosome segregation ATPase